MGTKSDPGQFDCYDKAKPNEPLFVLLGRDPLAPFLIYLWVYLTDAKPEQIKEALACADAMHRWRRERLFP